MSEADIFTPKKLRTPGLRCSIDDQLSTAGMQRKEGCHIVDLPLSWSLPGCSQDLPKSFPSMSSHRSSLELCLCPCTKTDSTCDIRIRTDERGPSLSTSDQAIRATFFGRRLSMVDWTDDTHPVRAATMYYVTTNQPASLESPCAL